MKRKAAKQCSTAYCRNKPTQGNICNSCRSRKRRAKNPMRYAYDTLKTNAKRRGKPFTITFRYFKHFAVKTNYLAGKGKTRESYSVDRIKNELGYVPGNLQVLTLADNSKKHTKVLQYDWETKTATYI